MEKQHIHMDECMVNSIEWNVTFERSLLEIEAGWNIQREACFF